MLAAIARGSRRHFNAWRRRKWAPSGPVNLKEIPQGSLQTGSGEDALEACKRWVACFATTEDSYSSDDEPDYELKKAAQFQHLVTSREGGHEHMTKMLKDYVKGLDGRLGTDNVTHLEQLYRDFCNLYHIALVAIQYTRGAVLGSYQSMVLDITFSHKKLISASSAGANVAFRIMQDLILGSYYRPSGTLYLFSTGYGIVEFAEKLVFEVFYGAWNADATFFQSQDLHLTYAKLMLANKNYVREHSSFPIGPISLQRAAGFLYDASIVGTRAQAVISILRRKLPTEIARMIADADIANVHPRLVTKGLNYVYSVTSDTTGDDCSCSCDQQMPLPGTGPFPSPTHTCPRRVSQYSNSFGWSHHLRGWSHQHAFVVPQDSVSSEPVNRIFATGGSIEYQWCRLPLDECAGHYDGDDMSWMASAREVEVLRQEIAVRRLKGNRCTKGRLRLW